jgi:predicted amidohydrolase YtcJ
VIADTAGQLLDAGTLLGAAGPRVRWQGLKRFGDGSFGGHTAAMHFPFADRRTTGTLRLDAADEALALAALDADKDVAIHAIGDLAVTRTVDLMEALRRLRPGDGRLRIEHVSVIRPADVARMASLGILASVQPPFMGSETNWIEDRVGADRLPMTYAFRTMADAGITLAGGSDCPVEKPDPWSGMALARDRAGLYPSEALSAEAAFVMYTAGGAAALGEPEPLAVGSPADLVVVDRDPVVATPDRLRQTRVLATYVDGIPVDISGGELPWPG